MKVIHIDWQLVLADLLELLVLTQGQFAKKLNTTQQSISNYQNGTRVPGKIIAQLIIDAAEKAGLFESLNDESKYHKKGEELKRIKKNTNFKSLSPSVKRLYRAIADLPRLKRRKLLTYLNEMIDVESKKIKE